MTDHGHGEFDWNQSYTGEVSDYAEPDSAMLDIIDTLEPGTALDIGCGAGGLVVALSQRGWQVTGIDIAEKAIEAARKIIQSRGVNADLLLADAATWKPTSRYNLITCSFALPGSRQERSSVYKSIRSALAPAGILLLKDFDSSMARLDFLADEDLVTVDEFVEAFSGLDIIRADIVETPVHDHATATQHDQRPWTAALLQARNP